jgi:hypothetical protein
MEDSKYTLMNYQTVLRLKLYIITICENLAKGKYFKSLKNLAKQHILNCQRIKNDLEVIVPKDTNIQKRNCRTNLVCLLTIFIEN